MLVHDRHVIATGVGRDAGKHLVHDDAQAVDVRPLVDFQNLEFRIGYDLTADVQKHVARNVVYGAVRLAFDPAGFGLLGR